MRKKKELQIYLFFNLNSISQGIVHHRFLIKCSMIHQFSITPSAHHITCPAPLMELQIWGKKKRLGGKLPKRAYENFISTLSNE